MIFISFLRNAKRYNSYNTMIRTLVVRGYGIKLIACERRVWMFESSRAVDESSNIEHCNERLRNLLLMVDETCYPLPWRNM